MQKKIFLTLIVMSLFYFTNAQQNVLEVISPAGGVNSTGNISLEWTLGEYATGIIYSDENMYTEGFHQPYLKVEPMPEIFPILDDEESTVQVQIFPNPVKSILEIKVQDKDPLNKVQLILTDLQGKHILQQEVDADLGFQKIDLSDFPSAVYILKCTRKDGTLLKSFKVIKTN